jgi:uncharacterized protein YegP (UPF0339 family)
MQTGEVHQASSGQWAWRIFDDDGDVCAGAGYESEDEARQAMQEYLTFIPSDPRSVRPV